MKANLDIDDELLTEAMKIGHHRSRRSTVEAALQHYVRWRAGRELLALRGKVKWIGNLDKMRKTRQ